MTNYKYIIRSIVHYRKQHLALFLGMMISAIVLSGALIVGDSIRFSLDQMVNTRLGKTRYAIVGGSRFMDTRLAGKLQHSLNTPAASVLMMKGIVIHSETGNRLNNAGVLGIDSSFNYLNAAPLPIPGEDEAVIGGSLAKRLNIKVGDDILVRTESASLIPVNAPFAREPVPTIAFRVRVTAIAGDDQLGRLNLGNDQSVVYNVFLSARYLSTRLEVQGLTNSILITGENKELSVEAIEKSLQSQWSLKDLGLSVKRYSDKGI